MAAVSSQSIYGVRAKSWPERLKQWFLLSLDLAEALQETSRGLKSIANGFIALVLVLPAILAAHAFFVGSYVMDFDSTLMATSDFRKLAMERMAWMSGIAFLAWSLQLLSVTFAFFSTAVEMLGSRFSHFRLPSWQVASTASIVFDAVTDIPRVNFFFVPLWAEWTNGATGVFGVLMGGPSVWFMALFWCLCWLLTLVASSYYLELLFVVACWIVVGLLWKSIGYWVLGFLAGKGWKLNFNATGGIPDDEVRGGQTSGSRPGPRPGPRSGGGPRPGHGPRGGPSRGPGMPPRGGPRRPPEDDDDIIDLDDDDI